MLSSIGIAVKGLSPDFIGFQNNFHHTVRRDFISLQGDLTQFIQSTSMSPSLLTSTSASASAPPAQQDLAFYTDLANVICPNCKGIGHLSRTCSSKPRAQPKPTTHPTLGSSAGPSTSRHPTSSHPSRVSKPNLSRPRFSRATEHAKLAHDEYSGEDEPYTGAVDEGTDLQYAGPGDELYGTGDVAFAAFHEQAHSADMLASTSQSDSLPDRPWPIYQDTVTEDIHDCETYNPPSASDVILPNHRPITLPTSKPNAQASRGFLPFLPANVEGTRLDVPSHPFIFRNGYWVIDTGATGHLTAQRALLTNIRPLYPPIILRTASTPITIKEIGTAYIPGADGSVIKLTDVLISPDPNSPNLLSIHRATAMNPQLSVSFTCESCTFTIRPPGPGPDRVLLSAPKRGKLFTIPLQPAPPAHAPFPEVEDAFPAVSRLTPETAEVWHARYGHLSYRSLAQATSQVIGIRTPPSAFRKPRQSPCSTCILAKMDKNPYPSSPSRAPRPLALIHLDLSGKIRIPSLKGAFYFQGILDDHSKYSATTFHPTKDTVPEITIDLLERWENKHNARIGTVRHDSGSEYTCGRFANWCKSKGIKQELTVPYNASSNGAAERLNRTLHERATAFLISARFPARYWAEMINNANTIRNLSPSSVDPAKCPFELFHGKKPAVDHLRIIGCTAFIHIPKDDRPHKMAPSARITRLVGSSSRRNRFTYRVALPDHTIIEVRDITFDEHENLAGTKGFAGPDAVVEGLFPETPVSELSDTIASDGGLLHPPRHVSWGAPLGPPPSTTSRPTLSNSTHPLTSQHSNPPP